VADMVIIIAVVIFLAGLVTGAAVIVCIGIRQEERDFVRTGLTSMTRRAPSLFSGGARFLTGLYVGQRADRESAAVREPAAAREPVAVRYRDRLA
jgi:hypothetical protein